MPPVTRTSSPPKASRRSLATTLSSRVDTPTRVPAATLTSSALTATPSTADTSTTPPADTRTSVELTLTSSPADASMRRSDATVTAPADRVPRCTTTPSQPSNVGPSAGSLRSRSPPTVCRAKRTLSPPSE